MNTESSKSNAVTVFLKLNGTECNMRCIYCYNHVCSSAVQHVSCSPLDVISYLSGYTSYQHLFIVFHGGEPLLTSPEDIRIILEYIDKSFKCHVNVQFQTNGTLINEKWLALFKQYAHLVSLSFSIDPDEQLDLRVYPKGIDKNQVWNNIRACCKIIDNVGIVSVAHRHNFGSFISFMNQLSNWGIHSLTINKYQSNKKWNMDDNYLTEMEYVDMLINVTNYWISSKLYKTLSIQPIKSLFSKNGSKICLYLFDSCKCTYFHTFFDKDNHTNFCDHVINDEIPTMAKECLSCDILQKCGGGCLVETKDTTFCEARHRLFNYIGGYRI